jgi:short-subunit dehydrogenase
LLLTARREPALRTLAAELAARHQVTCEVFPADLSGPQGGAELADTIAAAGWQVDVLVNNAGFGLLGRFSERPLSTQLQMIQLNVTALTELTGRFLPGMLQRKRGGILNVSSTTAFQAGPGMAVYFASKAFVQRFGEALAFELKDQPVSVTTLTPGPVATEFGNRSGMAQHRPARRNVMTATDVARIGHAAFRQRRATVIPGWRNRGGAIAVRWLPRRWVMAAIARYLLDRPAPSNDP